MIRLDTLLPNGQPGWLLISQIEHARLSGALASEWGEPPYPAVAPRDELLPAIVRHDDGWSDWERRPQLDSVGRPCNFHDMPVEDSLLIWRTSIERAAAMSPLGGATVAGHFLHLLRQALVWKEHGTRAAAATHQWAAEFDALRQDWLDDWAASRPENRPDVAATALAWLQFFDRLSLWFCMSKAAQPAEINTGGGMALWLSPQIDDDNTQTVLISPWPLRVAAFEISLCGCLVPARRYADAAELAATMQVPVTWRLRLLPA